jgi:CRISPR-associated protein Cas5t
MDSFCVEIITQTASFRNPEFQNFHKTLDLPPPTTIIGLAGAALGLSAKMAQEFFEETSFQIGIAGNSKGRMKDTWKYNKRTSDMHLYDPLLDGSVIQREQLVENQFLLAFFCEEETKLERLKNAFLNPVFALTMGNSDSLAMVKTVEVNLPLSENNQLKNCLVAGDVVGDVLRNAAKGLSFSIYQTSEPITYDLPVRFNYASDYGKRTVADTATFSFIGDEMQLNFEVSGTVFQKTFIPVFKL